MFEYERERCPARFWRDVFDIEEREGVDAELIEPAVFAKEEGDVRDASG